MSNCFNCYKKTNEIIGFYSNIEYVYYCKYYCINCFKYLTGINDIYTLKIDDYKKSDYCIICSKSLAMCNAFQVRHYYKNNKGNENLDIISYICLECLDKYFDLNEKTLNKIM